MDKYIFVYEIEKKDFYKDIAKDVKKKFDNSGYAKDDNSPLPIREKEKIICTMKDESWQSLLHEM